MYLLEKTEMKVSFLRDAVEVPNAEFSKLTFLDAPLVEI